MTAAVELAHSTPPIDIPIPPGYARVWSGQAHPGDLYLNRVAALAGRVEWLRVTFAAIIEDDGLESQFAEVYACLVRERAGEVGRPCERCGYRSPVEGDVVCWDCC